MFVDKNIMEGKAGVKRKGSQRSIMLTYKNVIEGKVGIQIQDIQWSMILIYKNTKYQKRRQLRLMIEKIHRAMTKRDKRRFEIKEKNDREESSKDKKFGILIYQKLENL